MIDRVDYIQLNREFRALSNAERADPNQIDADLMLAGRGLRWEQVLKAERVVVYASAGSGKTEELRAQERALRSAGRSAFFAPLEAIARDGLENYLLGEGAAGERFGQWKVEGASDAWFFLDSVDELKLTRSKLNHALNKFRRDVGQALPRAKIILSTRPLDWRSGDDDKVLLQGLRRAEDTARAQLSNDDQFMAVFDDENEDAKPDEQADARVLHIALQPLNADQVRTFAGAASVNAIDAFMREVEERDAWALVGRPLDLKAQIAHWNRHGRLGTKVEQTQAAIDYMLRDDAERERLDINALSADRARRGAERLALALKLKRCRTIALPDAAANLPEAVDAATVLSDWSKTEVEALLRRPMFDLAARGRVRFQNRDLEDFLSATRLKSMLDNGMPASRVRRLMLADRYGESALIPSMRSVAAWLAHWDDGIRREVLAREPEVLVTGGDPEGLPFETKEAILRAFFDAYRGGEWRGLELPRGDIQRLADPQLAGLVTEFWRSGEVNIEVRQLLMQLISLAPMADAMSIAFDAAMDEDEDYLVRILAVKALARAARQDDLSRIARDVIDNPSRWPDRVVTNVFDVLFPEAISADELVQLVRRVPEPKYSLQGFAWPLYAYAKRADLQSAELRELEAKMADAILDAWDTQTSWYHPKSELAQLAPALTVLTKRRLEAGEPLTQLLADNASVSLRFHHSTLASDESQELRALISKRPDGRRYALLADLHAAPDSIKSLSPRERLFRSARDGVLGYLREDDWPWLLETVGDPEFAADREVFFEAALDVWFGRGRNDDDLEQLREAAAGDNVLISRLEEVLKPAPPNPEIEAMEAEHRERQKERKAARERNRQAWRDWRDRVQSDPDAAFSDAERKQTLRHVIAWLREAGRDNTIAYANWRAIRPAIGDAFADRLEEVLRDYWRNNDAPLWSRLSDEEQGRIGESRQLALTGLLIEATTASDWPAALTAEEARRAAEWGLTELNGFPEWFEALIEHHPQSVQSVLSAELRAEFSARASLTHPHTLSAVRYGPDAVKQLVRDELEDGLRHWPVGEQAAQSDQSVHMLGSIIASRLDIGPVDGAVLDHCLASFEAAAFQPSGSAWLKALCASDLQRGVHAMEAALDRVGNETGEQPLSWLAALFGDVVGGSKSVSLDDDADLLVKLTRLAYQIAAPDDDVRHEGVYSPDARDNAQSARDRILTGVIDRPGPEAHAALTRLASEPLFAHMPDRLRHLAREKAAKDCEPEPVAEQGFGEFEQRYCISPRNNAQLSNALHDRFEQIDHDLKHHDFSDRPQLAEFQDEDAMQISLAKKLSDLAHNHFQVERETEVADKKEPDIRLIARDFSGKAAIEVKIADGNSKWSVRQLEDALKRQLVGQYLRHEHCRVGALVVTHSGRKGFRHPDTKAAMRFDEVIDHLNAIAARLVKESGYTIHLTVIGLDLRNPLEAE